VLNVQEEVFQSVHVGALSNPVDSTTTASEERLSGTEINDIPYPSTESLRNGMRLIPGRSKTHPPASISTAGGISDPIHAERRGHHGPDGGRYTTLLALDGVQSVTWKRARGRAIRARSGGTLAIHSENGTDLFHYTVTNFIPGIDQRGGVRIGDWAPRAVLSGPIVKGRAWFADSLYGSYNNGYVAGLPPGADTNAAWALGNLAHAQVNVLPPTFSTRTS